MAWGNKFTEEEYSFFPGMINFDLNKFRQLIMNRLNMTLEEYESWRPDINELEDGSIDVWLYITPQSCNCCIESDK